MCLLVKSCQMCLNIAILSMQQPTTKRVMVTRIAVILVLLAVPVSDSTILTCFVLHRFDATRPHCNEDCLYMIRDRCSTLNTLETCLYGTQWQQIIRAMLPVMQVLRQKSRL